MKFEDAVTMTKNVLVLPLIIASATTLPLPGKAQSPPAGPDPAALCRADELAAFSCDLGDRQVALCASSATSKMPGALHFRVKNSHSGTTSVFPAPDEEKGAFVEYGQWGESAGPPGNYYAITSGAKSYTAFATGGRGDQYGGPDAGFMIEQKGQKPDHDTCTDSNTEFNGPGAKLLGKIETSDGLDRSSP
jgi:hypothetical protein